MMVAALNRLLVGSLVLLAAATQLQAGTITYELAFTGAILRDYSGNDIGTYDGGFSLTTTSPITSAGEFTITSSFLSANAENLYDVLLEQTFDPNGFNTGKNYIGFNSQNDDLSASGTGFLFFESGAFSTNGVHHLATGTITNGVDFYGSFAAEATLTVSGINSVPEPSSIAVVGLLGIFALGAVRRTGHATNTRS